MDRCDSDVHRIRPPGILLVRVVEQVSSSFGAGDAPVRMQVKLAVTGHLSCKILFKILGPELSDRKLGQVPGGQKPCKIAHTN